jgi:hypothetical protein
MPTALEGALIGGAIALFLLVGEYVLLARQRDERAKRFKRPPQFDGVERRRIATIVRFCLCLPPAFAAFYWMVWG